jgi:hypothetical protein
MQKFGALSLAEDYTNNLTVHPLHDTQLTTYLDDERHIQSTTMTSPYLEGIPHAYIVTTPTFSSATYGLTLLAGRQLRWTTNIPDEYIHTRLPESLRKFFLAQVPPTIARKNVDKPNKAKYTCTIQSHVFEDLSATDVFNLFRAPSIQTLHKHLIAVDHRHQN